MKTIGHAENGDVIVTFPKSEFTLLTQLIALSKGQRLPMHFDYPSTVFDRSDEDMHGVIATVIQWAEVKDKVNALRQMADELERKLNPSTA